MEDLINHLNSAIYLFEAIGAFWMVIQCVKAVSWILNNIDVTYKGKDKNE